MTLHTHATSTRARRVRSATEKERAEDETIRDAQTEFRNRLKLEAPDVYLVPPDFGAQLYNWWKEKREGHTSSSPGRQPCSLSATVSVRHSFEDEVTVKSAEQVPQSPRSSKRMRHPSSVPQHNVKRSRMSSASSSAPSDVESIFSTREQKQDSMSSEIAHSDCQSSHPSPRTSAFQKTDSHSKPVTQALAKQIFPSLPTSPRDDVHFDMSREDSRTRPTTFPMAWEQAHPADKMLFSMGREGQNWRDIVDRWNQMTGGCDKARHLKWRYEVIEKTMGLQNHGGIDDDFYAPGTSTKLDPGVDFVSEWKKKASELPQAGTYDEDGSVPEESVEMAFEATRDPVLTNRSLGSKTRLGGRYSSGARKPLSLQIQSHNHAQRAGKGRNKSSISEESEVEDHSGQEDIKHRKDESLWVCLSLPSKTERLRLVQNSMSAKQEHRLNTCAEADPATATTWPAGARLPSMDTPPIATTRSSSRLFTLLDTEDHDISNLPKLAFLTRTGEIIQLQDPEAERRRKLSEALRAAWARRQAEGRNGRYGGVPRLSTIIKAEKGGGKRTSRS